MADAHTEVVEQPAGLPQLNVIADGTFTNQLAWLVLTFLVLFLVVSRMVLPRISKVMGEREEKVATDLDTAERLRNEAEEIRVAYEASVTDARAKAQQVIVATKETIQADIAKAQAALDKKLGTKADKAEKAIAKAREEALLSIDSVATEVATQVIAKLGGIEPKDKAVNDAVKAALDTVKGA
ncbi:F0F1 ATP synthase subunit B family protein [Kordiimonas pumila]|uniref:ATP synthase subunit b n=1 Tax=Kordiimonas pumila TaxID=2161677 RepID=A0ABV7D7E2_9PROT|nr:F0F1 ATP synthase subunit B' [Kordiimonas pumila]